MPKPKPVIAVMGVTRCGSTMMMRMLHAGGCPIYQSDTDPYSYETKDVLKLPRETSWLDGAAGQAVKILDAHNFTPPADRDYVCIVMRRSSVEQTKSIAKFMKHFGVAKSIDRQTRQRMKKGVIRDNSKVFQIAQRLGPMIAVGFASTLNTPMVTAEKVSKHLRHFAKLQLDTEAMAAQVHSRAPECLPYMAEEDFKPLL